ncbi:methyltransferase domain-containing protein [Hafnia psychrotolerans]|uniref:Protein kinase domain-containing protein n=1 Tax=Hafnia psychrotolerans TaxID=1477018 RepID=A0ABQ1G145_9GAMM|nr:methyltransferase domain-containing protein [Hafnia psychrotolerans]GGA34816.1 hypothetical protein GCM10011328_06970 [Hafnia psychrotolerans]
MKKRIETLVNELPEIYQTIYGYSELSTAVSRECHDRLVEIEIVYTALENKLGRPLRVLDFGCAQGFFCFSLAKRGASVVGVDFQKENIDLCNALAEENPEMAVRFLQGRIEEIITTIKDNEYDLITGLSVFHHIVHQHGSDTVRGWIADLAGKTAAMIFELALHEEPLYWAPSLPENPRDILNGCHFVHEIGRFSTHLSDISRPLYVASNRYWIYGDEIERFDHWTTESHGKENGAHQGTRRYYFSENRIAKAFELTLGVKERNEKEFFREVDFLNTPPKNYKTPELFVHGHNNYETWVVMEKIPGILLLDAINSGVNYDAEKVINGLLDKLVILESNGYYHDDIRMWNILLQEDNKVELIDYGSFSVNKDDCSWPFNIYFSFLILIYEISAKKVYNSGILRPPVISPYSLPAPYNKKLEMLWGKSLESWSFKEISDHIKSNVDDDIMEQPSDIQKIWMQVVDSSIIKSEECQEALKEELSNIKLNLANLVNGLEMVSVQSEELNNIKTIIDSLKHAEQPVDELNYVANKQPVDELNYVANEQPTDELNCVANDEYLKLIAESEAKTQDLLRAIDDLNNHISAKDKYIVDLENNIIAVNKSTSWRITWPLRKIKNFFVDPFSKARFARVKRAIKKIIIFFVKKIIEIVNTNLRIKNLVLMIAHKTKTYGIIKRIYYKYKKNDSSIKSDCETIVKTTNSMSTRSKKINSLLVKFDNSKRKQ